MSLSFVSGMEEQEVGKLFKSKKEREAAKQKRKDRRAKQGSRVAKIALAPARLAFLGLVSINALALGKKLAEAWKKDKPKVLTFWVSKFAGKEKALKEAIEKGSKQQIGVVTAAAALATATPILIACASLLKELGLGTEDVEQGIDDGLIEIENNPDFEKGYTNETLPQNQTGVVKPLNKPKPNAGETDDKPNNLIPIVLGGGLLLVLLKSN